MRPSIHLLSAFHLLSDFHPSSPGPQCLLVVPSVKLIAGLVHLYVFLQPTCMVLLQSSAVLHYRLAYVAYEKLFGPVACFAKRRYREKRKRRTFEKTIRYESRKAYAEVRPRIKGRFATKDEVIAMKAEAAALEKGADIAKGGTAASGSGARGAPAAKRSRRSKRANAGTKPAQADFVVPEYRS